MGGGLPELPKLPSIDPLDVVTGGLNAVGSAIDRNTLKPKRDQVNAEKNMIAAKQKTVDEIMQDELSKYSKGISDADSMTLTDAQKASLDKEQAAQIAAAKQYLSSAGMADSSAAVSEIANIGTNRAITEDNMLRNEKAQAFQQAETHFANASAMLGVSNQYMSQIMQLNAEASQQSMAALSGMMQIVGTIGGAMVGGPAGAAAGYSIAGGVGGNTSFTPGVQSGGGYASVPSL